MEPEDLLTIADVAKHLGVAESTVWREIDRGRLPAKKLRREYVIIARDLLAYQALPGFRRGWPKGKARGPRKPPPAP